MAPVEPKVLRTAEMQIRKVVEATSIRHFGIAYADSLKSCVPVLAAMRHAIFTC